MKGQGDIDWNFAPGAFRLLVSHGFDELFSSRPAVHALSDPAFVCNNGARCLIPCGRLWSINKTFVSSRVNYYSGHSCGKSSFLSTWPKESFSSCSSSAGSIQALLFHPIDPPLYWNGWMYWKSFLFFPTGLSFPPLLARTSERFISVCAGKSVSFLKSVLKKHPFLCFLNIMHLMSASTCGTEVLCSKHFAAFVVFSAVLLSNFHIQINSA